MTLFADRLRQARQRVRTASGTRMTQGHLAKAVGVERNTVSRWENSGVRPKDPAVIARLADVLRVSMEWLVASGDEPRQSAEQPLEAYSASLALERRLPPEAYELILGYVRRVEASGATAAQTREAQRLLLEGAFTSLRRPAPRERVIAIVLGDVEAMWRYITSVLAQDGIDVISGAK